MTDYLLLFVGTVLVNNFVLVKFLGLCPVSYTHLDVYKRQFLTRWLAAALDDA